MSETKKPSSIPSVSSLENLSLLASDSGGAMRRLSSSLFIPLDLKTMRTVDLNEMTTTGIYVLSSGCTNQPTEGDSKVLIVLATAQGIVYQICMRAGENSLHFRARTSESWKNWIKIV